MSQKRAKKMQKRWRSGGVDESLGKAIIGVID